MYLITISGLQNLRQIPLDPGCYIRFIHGIDMDMFHAIGQQVDDLIGGIGDACLFHGFRVISEAVYDIFEAFGNITAGQFYGISHLYTAGNEIGRASCRERV